MTLRAISSMATRQVLAELSAHYRTATGVDTKIESVGGVDAARRVKAGEPFDVVFLASEAIDQLAEGGAVVAGSRVDIVRSSVGVIVKAGAPPPDLATEDALKRAVLDAPTIGYSTGPSGSALIKLFERWGIAETIRDRLVQAAPGVPVASMVADGKAALGFQQLSELIHVPGIALVGPLPGPVQIVTTFSGAICATCAQPQAAGDLLRFLASPVTADTKRRQGMEPA
jgi:molybdate transport system substrate-binding protein